MAHKFEERLRDVVDKYVYKVIGEKDNNLTTVAINCINKGLSKEKLADKLYPILGSSRKADKLATYLQDLGSQKRKDTNDEASPVKKMKLDDETVVAPATIKPDPNKVQLSQSQIKDMMMNARQMIAERKQQLTTLVPPTLPNTMEMGGPEPGSTPLVPPVVGFGSGNAPGAIPGYRPPMRPPPQAGGSHRGPRPGGPNDPAERMRQLQESIQKRVEQIAASKEAREGAVGKPVPLILDERGQTVDKSGQVISLVHRTPTALANMRAARREHDKVHPEEGAAPEEETALVEAAASVVTPAPSVPPHQQFFDPRIGRGPSAHRGRRKFEFHEKGKFESLAARMRAKQQLEKLQSEIAAAAKKTGIQSSVKLALIQPKKEVQGVDEIPEVEWWDQVILKRESYPEEGDVSEDYIEGITHLVEHPAQLQPPIPEKGVVLPLHLTKSERKKLRRQNRREAWKDKQEKIRLGLEPPPEPKVRLANMMRALGQDAVQDPTKVEAHVRAQMAKRQKAHEEANAARKLTAEQQKDKKAKKLKEDTSEMVHVSVYRLRDFNLPAKKFKVEANANQLFMTGFVVLHKDCNVVVVEGGPKQQKKFKQLMLHRIKWEEDLVPISSGSKQKAPNQCVLVWEGTTKTRSFGDIRFKVAPTEALAREYFSNQGVAQYWDLAYSTSVLDTTEEL